MFTPRKLAVALCSLSVMLLFAGCWASKFTLIPQDQAKVDHAYLGDWDAVNAKGNHSVILIRNLDNKLYYVETHTTGDDGKDQAARYVGFLADVKAARFAHVRPIQDDGEVSDQWLLMRVELTGDKMVIRQFSDEFFKARTIDSAEQLRKVIEENMGNEQMYGKDETVTATRVAGK